MTVDVKVNVARCVAVRNVTRLSRFKKILSLIIFVIFFGKFTERHVTETYRKFIFKKKVI